MKKVKLRIHLPVRVLSLIMAMAIHRMRVMGIWDPIPSQTKRQMKFQKKTQNLIGEPTKTFQTITRAGSDVYSDLFLERPTQVLGDLLSRPRPRVYDDTVAGSPPVAPS